MTTSADQTTHPDTDHAVAEQKSFSAPDETRTFERGQVDLLQIGGSEIGRLTLQPGWRWSQHVRPLAGTDLCEAPHFQYHVAGTLHIVMADGTQFDARPGDVRACLELTCTSSDVGIMLLVWPLSWRSMSRCWRRSLTRSCLIWMSGSGGC